MTITPKDFELNRRHDYMPEGCALMNVHKLQDGTFEGRIDIGHMTRRFPTIVENTETALECRKILDKRFSEVMPEHQCGSGCHDWQVADSDFGEPSGTVQ